MAACADLHHVFERPLPKTPTYHEPFSPWTHSSPSFSKNPNVHLSFFDILKNNENWEHNDTTTNLFSEDVCKNIWEDSILKKTRDNGDIDNFHTMDICQNVSEIREERTNIAKTPQYHEPNPSSKTHQLFNEEGPDLCPNEHEMSPTKYKRSRTSNSRGLPPPISCLGRSGKPCVCLKSIREDGRLILQVVTIPRKGRLHSSHANGRLKLQFIYSDDESPEEDEEEEGERNKNEQHQYLK